MTARYLGEQMVILLLMLSTAAAGAQAPSFEQSTGHGFGERITQHHEMVRYLERLASSSPRLKLVKQGESWEGRALLLAIVTSPENHARLDEIKQVAQRLGDPRDTPPAEARTLMQRQPVIVWFGGSIHGFELSGSEGVLKLLEHLTTHDDPATLEVLRNAIVLIDPMLNPDGRDAFANINHENTGRVPSPARDDWSNDFTGWEGLKFRTGHYYFDTNRDWFAHTQRETRARMPTLLAWRPQVVVDMHEMGIDVEFFFDPPAEPYGPFFPDFAFRWFKRFGSAYAEAFDSAGFEYMTRERYNYFYPGYTTSMGSYQGAVGMLFEQGSSRGLAIERPDGSVRRLSDALEQQYVAAWTAAHTAARERARLVREYYNAHRDAIADADQGIRRYLIARREGDPGLVADLVDLLIRNGIEVDELTEPAELGGMRDRTGRKINRREFPAGTYVVDAAQPRNRLLRALLEPDVSLPDAFLKEARRRVERDEDPRFYDITAWSLPLLFNVGGYSSTDDRALATRRVSGRAQVAAKPSLEGAGYAYLIDGRQAKGLAALQDLTSRGVRAAVTLKPTRIGGVNLSSGTVVVRVGQNDSTVHSVVRELARRFGLEVRAVGTGHAEPGFPSLGSGDVIPVKAPEIAMLAEEPVQGYSFGWAWYTLDRQHEIPVTVLRVRSVANNTQLGRFNVIIVPSAEARALAMALGQGGVARLKRWVQDGGTLVALGAAVDFARDSAGLGMLALRSWYDSATAKNDSTKRPQAFRVPGAILRTTLDPETWLTAGYDARELPALVNSSRIYLAPEGAPSAQRRTIARYARKDSLRLAGHVWAESLARLPGAVFAYEQRVGTGRVIAFAEDLNFRGYWRGANRLFLNAVVLGPSGP